MLSVIGTSSTFNGDINPGVTTTAAILGITSASTVTLGSNAVITITVTNNTISDVVDFNAAVSFAGTLRHDGTYSTPGTFTTTPVLYDSRIGATTFGSVVTLLPSSAIVGQTYNATNFQAGILIS